MMAVAPGPTGLRTPGGSSDSSRNQSSEVGGVASGDGTAACPLCVIFLSIANRLGVAARSHEAACDPREPSVEHRRTRTKLAKQSGPRASLPCRNSTLPAVRYVMSKRTIADNAEIHTVPDAASNTAS
jgi:hypothetical protein